MIDSEAETRALGLRIASAAEPGDIIALVGDLGTGKTALTKYIAEGLGVTEEVISPTFNIVKEYRSGRIPLFHFDVYRLSGPEEFAGRESGGWEIGDEARRESVAARLRSRIRLCFRAKRGRWFPWDRIADFTEEAMRFFTGKE